MDFHHKLFLSMENYIMYFIMIKMSTKFPYILFLSNPWKLVKLEKKRKRKEHLLNSTQPTDVICGPEFNPKVIVLY